MALPDYFEISQGTAIIFGESGATGVTHTMGLDALGSGAARMSASADLGADYADEYLVIVRVETGTAPTAGNTVELYLLSSYDNTNWPAKVTGSDGTYTLGTADANLRQAGPPVSVLVATADGTTVLEQAPVIWRPRGRYVVAVLDNNLGQAFKDETTANSANDSRVILIPRRQKINE
jgi:hypothetical protein